MGRNLSLLARLPRLEEDGVTHRRDCECVRCDAGFRPSEQQRAEARRRFDERRARERASRAAVRAAERAQMKQAQLGVYLDAQVDRADALVRELRAARERVSRDARLRALWALRRSGLSLEEALATVDGQRGD